MADDFYNDHKFSYLNYWQDREYEHQSELIALDKLLGSHHFQSTIDLGGGYGRLIPYLLTKSDLVTLVEPSSKQRQLARRFLPKNKRISIKSGSDHASGLSDQSADLVILIRVIHHLSDTLPVFTEIRRILTPDGLVVFEFANSLNFKSRLRDYILGLPISKFPVDLRSPQNQNPQTIPFLNHHPETILKTLHLCRLEPLKLLSVSNFRSRFLKKILPLKLLLLLEKLSQSLLSSLYCGPSIFVLARKTAELDNPLTP